MSELASPQDSASSTEAATIAVPTLKRRFLCMVYESMLLFGVVFIASYLFDTLTQSRSGLMFRHQRQFWLFMVLGIYFSWFWTHGGQTLAMKTWRIRLVDANGKAVTPARALLRYVLCWMFLLPALGLLEVFDIQHWPALVAIALALVVPPFWAHFDRDHQFIHDRLLGTRLITQ